MPSLEAEINDLYGRQLEEFVAARTALAKSLTGADAQRVKALKKPTIVPWAVNQLYWHARPVFEHAARAGQLLRAAQVAALGGRKGKVADVAGAEEAHRKAVADAAKTTAQLAARNGIMVSADEVMRTIEAISLTTTPPEPLGRLTKPIAPAGFEALSGIVVKPSSRAIAPAVKSAVKLPAAEVVRHVESPREKRQRHEEEAAEHGRAAAIVKAEAVLFRAQAAESQARINWQNAKRSLDAAERELASLRSSQSDE